MGRAQQKAVVKYINQLGSTRDPVDRAALALPGYNEKSGQILGVVVYKLKKRRESYEPQFMGLRKNLFFIFWSHFSSPLETCNSTLRKSLNLFKSHFPSVKLGMIKIVPCSSKGLSYCYQNILQRGSYSCGN